MPNWPTAPSSNAVTYFLQYSVFFKIREEYDSAVALFAGQSLLRSPAYVRDALGVPENAPWGSDKWFWFTPSASVINYNMDMTWGTPATIRSKNLYLYPHKPSDNPNWWPPDVFTYDWAQDWVEAPAHAAVNDLGPIRPVAWIWACSFSMQGAVSLPEGGEGPDPPDPEDATKPIVPRRFMTGFEVTNGGNAAPITSPELDSGIQWADAYSRCASRTPDGVGFACRESGLSTIHALDEQFPGVSNNRNSWERFYLRIQKYPTTITEIWAAFTNGNESVDITISSTGQLNAYTINNFIINSGPLGAGSTLALNVWYRVDIYLIFTERPNPSGGCDVSLIMTTAYGQITPDLTVFGSVNIGFGPIQRFHASSRLGPRNNIDSAELDYDDWSNMNPGDPDGMPPTSGYYLNTIDYKMGHHIQLIRNVAPGSITNWTGDYRATMQTPTSNPVAVLSSTTSDAVLSPDTELDGTLLSINASNIAVIRQAGPVAISGLAVVSKGVASTTDQVGTQAGAFGQDLTTKSMGVALSGYGALRNICSDDLLEEPPLPAESEPIVPILVKSTDSNLTNASLLMVEAQFCGAYGPEDGEFDLASDVPSLIGYHNAPYYGTLLGLESFSAASSVGIASGTYVGNGTGQDITIGIPGVHFFYARNLTTSVKTWWWSTMLGPHAGAVDDDIFPALAIQFKLVEGETILSIAGNHASNNENGVTYQYFAFSDIMSRVLLNHTWKHSLADRENLLFDSEFLPEFVLLQLESVKHVSAATNMWIKGPGFASDEGKKVDNTAVNSNVMTFEPGNITSRSGIIGVFNACPASWRSTDGRSDIDNIVYIGQYTGNGAVGTRDITIQLNGMRPIFAIICPVTNVHAVVRDPSNSGLSSSRVQDGATSTTAITGGGIDMIQVGVSLNTNGIAYSMLVIPSCSTDEGNDGWGIDNVCGIAPPTDAPGWVEEPPAIPADIAILGEGGIVLDGETSKLMILSMSGIYTITPGKTDDTILDRQVAQEELDVKIPDPFFKTGYIGG